MTYHRRFDGFIPFSARESVLATVMRPVKRLLKVPAPAHPVLTTPPSLRSVLTGQGTSFGSTCLWLLNIAESIVAVGIMSRGIRQRGFAFYAGSTNRISLNEQPVAPSVFLRY